MVGLGGRVDALHLKRTVGPIVFDAPAVFKGTPDAKSDSIATICPALGGSPA